MADPLSEEQERLRESLNISAQLVDSLKKRNKLEGESKAINDLSLNVAKQILKQFSSIAATVEKRVNKELTSKQLAKEREKIITNQRKLEDASLEFLDNYSGKLLDVNHKVRSIEAEIVDIKDQIQDVDQKNLELEIKRVQAIKAGNTTLSKQYSDAIKENQREANALDKQLKKQEKLYDQHKDDADILRDTRDLHEQLIREVQEEVDILEKEIVLRKQIEKSTGVTGAILKSLSNIPGLGKFSKFLKTEEANKEMEEYAAKLQASGKNVTSLGNRAKIAFKGISSLVKGILQGLKDPVSIIVALIAQGVKADKQATELAKTLVITKKEAFKVRGEFVEMSRSIKDSYINTDRLIKANQALGQQLGFNKVFTQDMNTEFINLTEKIGISEESAGGLAKLTLATGKNMKQTKVEALGAAQAISKQVGVQLNNKEILEDVGKVSGQILSNFKASPAALAQAVAQSKSLGTSLETARKQGEALLNFESSIENELKAELLIGKAINLEKARSAALTGDLSTVMEELNNQNVDFNKYSEMNVVAQKAFAESIGLSSDELSDQLLKQKYINASIGEVSDLEGEAVAKRLESLRATDKLSAAMDKLADIFGNLVAGPIGILLDLLGDIAGLITGIVSGIQDIFGSKITRALLGGIAGFLIGGPVGAAIGIGAGLLLGDDVVSPGDNAPEGYGTRTLMSPEGSIALNNKDTVVAGTNLFPDQKQQSSSPSINLAPLINAINEVKNEVKNINKQPGLVLLDGKKVGTTLVQGSYKLA